MKIYYRYNGFIRSSELNLIENAEEEFRETFVLLGEFGEEIYDLFGIVLVEKSWNSSDTSYNISGFNKTGNGNLGYYEEQTLQVLYNIFKESWDYIQTEEEALEQLDITVERLDIEIVPNPDKLNDKDDLYTYLDPSQRIIKSCSRVKVKVPQPDIACIPTSLTASGRVQESNEKSYLTISRNGGPKIVIITPDSTASEEDVINFVDQQLKLLYFAQDEKSVAFMPGVSIIGIEPQYDSEGNALDFLTGISTNGIVNYLGTDYDIKNGIYDFNSLIKGQLIEVNNPIIIPETNTITFYPTDNVIKELDRYYDFEGDDFGTPVTIISCAKVLSEEVTCIPTNVTFSKEYHSVKPHIITVSRNGGPFITFDLNSSDLDKDLYFRTMSLSISGDGLAFVDGRENLYDYIVRGVINEPIFGISVDGSININESPVYLENEKIIYNHTIIEAPYIIQEETNWLTFIPTEGAHPDSDKFYKLYGNKENDQITVYSCAYLTKDWNNLPYIPTKYLI